MKNNSVGKELDLFSEEDFQEKEISGETICDAENNSIADKYASVSEISDDSDSTEDVCAESDTSTTESKRTELTRLRASSKKLRVTFPDSSAFCYKSATVTYIETLKRIGVDRLKDVCLYIKDVPLFSKEINPRYKDFTKPLGKGWYAIIQSDTEQKYMQLSSIKQQLGLDIKIEVGTDFETDKTKGFGKRAEKSSMMVKFPDGQFIAGAKPIETFVLTLEKIGIRQIHQKKIQFGSKQLITTSKNYSTQVQSSDGYWVNVPGTTKEKYKQLKVIGAHMRVDLEITLL